MKIETALVPSQWPDMDVSGSIAVVIDVLRFTTTAARYLDLGAAGIKTTSSPGEAQHLRDAGMLKGPIILAGERSAKRIPGFDFGNSPLEFHRHQIQGATILMTTTNGTAAVSACLGAETVLLANLRNARSIAGFLRETDVPVVLVPAGLRGQLGLEDLWCAGYISSLLENGQWTDSTRTAVALYRDMPLDHLRQGEHAKTLQQMGLGKDLEYCLTLDEDTLLPGLNDAGLFVPLRSADRSW